MKGFRFQETMTGSYHRNEHPDDELPLSFTIQVSFGPMLAFLRSNVATMAGSVTAEGLTKGAPLYGTLGLHLLTRGTLNYHFDFTADDGSELVFDGKKTVSLTTLPESMTVLPAKLLTKDGAPVGEALLRFDLRGDLWPFLASFKRAR